MEQFPARFLFPRLFSFLVLFRFPVFSMVFPLALNLVKVYGNTVSFFSFLLA